MKILILSCLFLSSSLILAQSQENDQYPESVKDSIAILSKLLSNDWILEGYYFDNKYVERTLRTYSWVNDSCESLIQTKNGIVKVTQKHREIIKVDSTDYHEVISFSFRFDGFGRYDHLMDSGNSEIEEDFTNYIESCPSFPEIIYSYEKYFLKFTNLGGESYWLIHLANEKALVFVNEKNERIRYKKKNFDL